MSMVLELIMTRRSIRAFTGDAIAAADLDSIIRAGMAAPSAVNIQPWAFVVVTDKAKLLHLQRELPYAKMLDKAGAAIIVCGIPGHAVPLNVIPIGVPAGKEGRPIDKYDAGNVHRDRW